MNGNVISVIISGVGHRKTRKRHTGLLDIVLFLMRLNELTGLC